MNDDKFWSSIGLCCINCTRIGQFIPRKIIQIVPSDVTLRLKCTKFDFGWGSAPDPAGELTALPRPSRWISGVLFLRGGKGRVGKKRRGKGDWDSNDLLNRRHCFDRYTYDPISVGLKHVKHFFVQAFNFFSFYILLDALVVSRAFVVVIYRLFDFSFYVKRMKPIN